MVEEDDRSRTRSMQGALSLSGPSLHAGSSGPAFFAKKGHGLCILEHLNVACPAISEQACAATCTLTRSAPERFTHSLASLHRDFLRKGMLGRGVLTAQCRRGPAKLASNRSGENGSAFCYLLCWWA